MINSRKKQYHTINCRGRLIDLREPTIMGIINMTPDSYYSGSRISTTEDLLETVRTMSLSETAIIDIGAMSSRPGATELTVDEEINRIVPAIEIVRREFPSVIISADVYRAPVALAALKAGAHIVNDIGGGIFDMDIMKVCGDFKAPYILMHNRSKPDVMATDTEYDDLIMEMMDFFYLQVDKAKSAGILDIIVDPGIGFSKSGQHNFQILKKLNNFSLLRRPILVGLSRKSFIYKTLDVSVKEALNGTTAMHMVALHQGASILRVHDVYEARQCITLFKELSR